MTTRPTQDRAPRRAPRPPVSVDVDYPDELTVSSARAGRRAFALLVLSAVLPGSAQMLVGNRAVGRLILRIWFVLLGAVVLLGLLAWVNLSTVVGLLSASWFLRLAQWVLTIWAVVWVAVLVDAWRLSRPATQPARVRRRMAIATVALMVLPAGTAYAASSVSAGRQALATVFAQGDGPGMTDGRYNILLLGGDGGANRVGIRPDTIQVVSVDGQTGRAVMFAFTRDMSNIVFEPGSVMAGLMPEGWTCGDDCLLNGLYTWAHDHADEFPEGTEDVGILATREAVEAASGLDIHYHVLVDLAGFESVINALGGLEIDVLRRTPIAGVGGPITGWIEPGRQRLDGRHALWYARSRAGSTNYERMARQRCVLTAMSQQIDPVTLATRFSDLARSTSGVLQTDIPQSQLGTLAELALKTRSQKIGSVSFVPPLILPWDYDPDFVRATVAEAIEASESLDDAQASRTSGVAVQAPTGGASSEPTSAETGGADPSGPAPVPSPQTSTADQPTEENPAAGLERPGEDEHAVSSDAVEVCSVG